MLKIAIVTLLLASMASLLSGLVFLVRDEGHTSRVFWALALRVSLAALTLILIAWGLFSGQLVPHGP